MIRSHKLVTNLSIESIYSRQVISSEGYVIVGVVQYRLFEGLLGWRRLIKHGLKALSLSVRQSKLKG